MGDISHQFLDPYVVAPAIAHTATVILLHGRGSTGEEFASDLFECQVTPARHATKTLSLQSPSNVDCTLPQRFPSWKWVFPTTKLRYSSTFQEEMHEWFDTVSLMYPSEREELQVPGLSEAIRHLREIIVAESKIVGTSRIILGGISQGYATALHVLMAGNEKLAAFVGLSGWLPFGQQIEEAVVHCNGENAAECATDFVLGHLGHEGVSVDGSKEESSWARTPIYLGHETGDEIVESRLGEEACRVLKLCGAQPTWHTYNSGEHWLKEPEELEDIVEFLAEYVE